MRPRIVVAATLAALLAGVAIASAALGGDAAKPPPRSLASAVHGALTAPDVGGVSARIRFTNHLVASGDLPRDAGGSPLLAGASGRAWIARDGRFRLELQSENGDAQIVGDGRRLVVYDGRTNTRYTATLPRERRTAKRGAHAHRPPTLAEVRRGLARLAERAAVSGAIPANVAGQKAYEVTLAPRRDAGLVGQVSAAWDAARGVPLRLALTAKGSGAPVLELEATDISYGAVPASRFVAPDPPGVERVRVDLAARRAGDRSEARAGSFPAVAPRTLAGRPRTALRRGDHGALVRYGHGLGGLVVLETTSRPKDARALRGLPAVSLGPVTGRVLSTPLGTVVRWRRDGVTYTLAGSVTAATARAAAGTLAAR